MRRRCCSTPSKCAACVLPAGDEVVEALPGLVGPAAAAQADLGLRVTRGVEVPVAARQSAKPVNRAGVAGGRPGRFPPNAQAQSERRCGRQSLRHQPLRLRPPAPTSARGVGRDDARSATELDRGRRGDEDQGDPRVRHGRIARQRRSCDDASAASPARRAGAGFVGRRRG